MLPRLTLFCYFLLLLCPCARAQKTIYGVVTDARNKPVSWATVHAVGTTAGTYTYLDGYYELELPSGSEALEISFMGYQPRRVRVAELTSDEWSVRLYPGGIAIDEIIVTARQNESRTGCWRTCIWEVNDAQVDLGVTTALSRTTAYPNPFTQDLTLRTDFEADGSLNIQLLNALGQTLHHWPERTVGTGDQHHALRLPVNLPPGAYFLRLTDGTGREMTKRIVKAGTISKSR